ncbi:MAG: hypothetical protein CL534_11830 [Ahrensia sp.]|nr:hypothetical protein [Ahrensia sp.]
MVDTAVLRAVSVRCYAAELYARMAVRPTRQRRSLIEVLIYALVEQDIWDRLDGFYVMAAHDIQAARLNWVGCMQDLTSVNGPVFEVDSGFEGDGVSSYLDSCTLGPELENFKPNDATMGIFCNDTPASRGGLDIGLPGSYLIASSQAGDTQLRANYNTHDPIRVPRKRTGDNLIAWSRWRDRVQVYEAGSRLMEASIDSEDILNQSLKVLMVDGNYSVRRVSAVIVGGALSSEQHAVMYSALAAYLRGVSN